MKKVAGLLLVMLLGFTLAGCGDDNEEDTNVIYTTIYPVQYLVETIGGNTVTVKRVPGSTSHSHEDTVAFSAQDQIDMANADLLFYVGAELDTYIDNLKETVFNEGDVDLINFSDTLEYAHVCYAEHAHDHEHEEEEENHEEEVGEACDANSESDDPHFWLNPKLMLQAAEVVKDELIVMYPDNSDLYTSNFTVLKAQLEKLDEDLQAIADEATKPLITSTMIFNYFHEGYEIEILTIINSDHGTEPDPDVYPHIVEEALYHDIDYILFTKNETFPDTVLTELQVENPDAQIAYLHALGNLTTEELDAGLHYMSIMYENLAVLEEATK